MWLSIKCACCYVMYQKRYHQCNAMQVLAVKSDDQSQADLQTGQQIQNSVVVFIMLAEYN